MRYLFLLSLLVTTCAARAQAPDSLTGLRKLDQQNGFLNFNFGTLQRRIHGLKKTGPYTYHRTREHRKIGPYRVKTIRYGFIAGQDGQSRLFDLVIDLADSTAIPHVLTLLRTRYGPGTENSSAYCVWLGSQVRLSYRPRDGRIHVVNMTMGRSSPNLYYSPPR